MTGTMLIVDVAIKPGRTEHFRVAAAALFERSQGEPGTLRYDYFISDDGTRIITIEVFKDADGFLAHMSSCADLLPAFGDAADIVRVDVLGDDSDELYAALEGNSLEHFSHLGGITS